MKTYRETLWQLQAHVSRDRLEPTELPDQIAVDPEHPLRAVKGVFLVATAEIFQHLALDLQRLRSAEMTAGGAHPL